MKTVRISSLLILVFASLFVFASCIPNTAANGGGTVLVDGVPVAGGQAAPAEQTQPGTAPAADVPAEQTMGILGTLIQLSPFVLIFVVMYFLMIRPQRKQQKATRAMQDGLRVNDNVVTTSGFYGKIVGVGTDAFLVEFGEGRGFKVWVRKNDISGIKTPVMTPPAAAPSDK